MADSDAVRSRRKRAHAQGDHSLCRSGKCAQGVYPRPVAYLPDPVLDTGELDPAAELRALAGRLAAAYAADTGNAALARELRATLLAIPEARDEFDPLEALRARYREMTDG
jgi:hypothetical protein